MAKRTLSTWIRLNEKKCFYVWEFIRRNSEYKKDYKSFLSRFHKLCPGRPAPNSRHDCTRLEEQIGLDEAIELELMDWRLAFTYKWGTTWPCDPTYSNPNELDDLRRQPIISGGMGTYTAKSDWAQDIPKKPDPDPLSELFGEFAYDLSRVPIARIVQLRIRDRCEPELEPTGCFIEVPHECSGDWFIDKYSLVDAMIKEQSERLVPNSTMKRKPICVHLDNLHEYLAVWDLKKNEEDLSFAKIATRFSGGGQIVQRETIFAQYKTACWLIEKFGFLEIR